nr:MAG TPA: hypothetical protein [Caudoviricetes sp.]
MFVNPAGPCDGPLISFPLTGDKGVPKNGTKGLSKAQLP